METIKPRIIGSEMEYAVQVKHNPGAEVSHGFIRQDYLEHTSLVASSCSYLSNGARFYDDLGNHPEYASPEVDSALELAAAEIAGERIVYGAYERARRKHTIRGFELNKRLIDDNGITWGHHENYLVDRDTIDLSDPGVIALLGIYLATANLFAGAGTLYRTGRGTTSFAIAQKALDLRWDVGHGTTGKDKSLINTRDEPHANPVRFRRLHITSGDANMSPWAIRMKFGMTSLVLRLLEQPVPHGRFFDESIDTPVYPLHRIAKLVATNPNHAFWMNSGKKHRAIDIQSCLAQAARNLAAEVDLPAEELWTIDQWERACTDMHDNPGSLGDRVEWQAKLAALRSRRDKHGLTFDSPELRKYDKAWGNIGPKSIGLRLRDGLWSQWMPPKELISDRLSTPPPTTRARLRGMFITAFGGIDKDTCVTWHSVSHRGKPFTFNLSDPSQAYNDRLERYIRHYTTRPL